MEITPLAGATNPGATAPATGSDYQTFLTMLTVQMQNQDPLNPMEPSDFAAQLATFSAVEQQTYTNQLLSAMLGQGGLAELGGWVGMEARILGGAWFDGTPVPLAPDLALGADAATLIVRNGQGAVVDSRALDPAAQSYAWDGYGPGGRVADGAYTFELESRLDGALLDTQPVAAYAPVIEARFEAGATLLVLPGGLMVDSAQVSGLRRPGNAG